MSYTQHDIQAANIRVNPALHIALTQICVSEAGFQIKTDDCRLIYEALKNRSEQLGKGRKLNIGIMRSYSRAVFNQARITRRWILRFGHIDINRNSHNQIMLRNTGRNYFFIYAYTAKLIANDGMNIPYWCHEPIHHWGFRGWFMTNTNYRNWSFISCGYTFNHFWMVTNLIPNNMQYCW